MSKIVSVELPISTLDRMTAALRAIDAHDAIQLDGLVRLDIARNINVLLPEVEAFARQVGREHRKIKPGNENIDSNNKVAEEIEKMRARVMTFDLVPLDVGKLRLDDNKRITGEMIAALAPILTDFGGPAKRSAVSSKRK